MMSQINSWEDRFPEAILSVEELLSSGKSEYFSKSKLRLALENNFLNWTDYKNWAVEFYQSPSLNFSEAPAELRLNEKLNLLKTAYTKNKIIYEHIDYLSADLIALDNWDGNVIFLGLEKNIRLSEFPGSVFILCSHDVLNTILAPEAIQVIDSSLLSHDDKTEILAINHSDSLLEKDVDLNIKLDANSDEEKTAEFELDEPTAEKTAVASFTEMQTQTVAHTPIDVDSRLWKNINNQHQDFSTVARKKFDAYIVLRINSEQKTELFKMDEDLLKENLPIKLFEFDLKVANPFQNVFSNQFTETFNINQLNMQILDFKYACISALKLGPKVVGFLVGFKTTNLSQDDISALESLSEKAV